MAGKGPCPPGFEMLTLKLMDSSPSDTSMVSVLPEKEPLTELGFGGLGPSSYSAR